MAIRCAPSGCEHGGLHVEVEAGGAARHQLDLAAGRERARPDDLDQAALRGVASDMRTPAMRSSPRCGRVSVRAGAAPALAAAPHPALSPSKDGERADGCAAAPACQAGSRMLWRVAHSQDAQMNAELTQRFPARRLHRPHRARARQGRDRRGGEPVALHGDPRRGPLRAPRPLHQPAGPRDGARRLRQAHHRRRLLLDHASRGAARLHASATTA